MNNTPDFLIRAMAIRIAAGLTVEVLLDDGPHLRHCVNEADRDAYLARCATRGEVARIVEVNRTHEGQPGGQ